MTEWRKVCRHGVNGRCALMKCLTDGSASSPCAKCQLGMVLIVTDGRTQATTPDVQKGEAE